jgi:hypothetical protein
VVASRCWTALGAVRPSPLIPACRSRTLDQRLYLVDLSPSKALLQYSAPLYAKFTMQNASTPVRVTVPMLRRFPVHAGARTGLARTIRIDAEREYVDGCLRDHHPLDALKARKIGHSVYIGHIE